MKSLQSVVQFKRHLGRAHAAILGLFENRNAAQIGIGEPDVPGAAVRQALALLGKQEAWRGPHHGVSQAHDVNMRDAGPDVGMRALQIVQDGLLPVAPILVQQ